MLASRVFFFSSRRRHTRCYRDWSSDVCSSDLPFDVSSTVRRRMRQWLGAERRGEKQDAQRNTQGDQEWLRVQIGRASCRERVEVTVEGVASKGRDGKVGRESVTIAGQDGRSAE